MTAKAKLKNILSLVNNKKSRAVYITSDDGGFRVIRDNGKGYCCRSIRFESMAWCAMHIGHSAGSTGNEMDYLANLCSRFFRMHPPTVR